MEQLADIARLMGQLFVCEKSPEFVPTNEIPLKTIWVCPVLVSVMVCGSDAKPMTVIGNVSAAGEMERERTDGRMR